MEIVESVFPTKNPGNVESSKKLNFLCVRFDSGCVFVPVFPTFFCFIGKNRSGAAKPCPQVIEPIGKGSCAIVMEIEEPRVSVRMVEKCPIIGHFVIIVIVCWRIENDGKFPFF